MKVYGKEVSFKITNIDDAKNFQKALENIEKNENTVKEIAGLVRQGKAGLYDLMDTQMKMFRAFFIDCTGEDVLEECRDLQIAKDEYNSFIEELNRQTADYTNKNQQPVITPVAKNLLGTINV